MPSRKADQGMNWIRKAKREAIYKRDGFTCVHCGKKRGEKHDDGKSVVLTLDHVKPSSEGGTNDDANLVTSCHKCNSARGSKSIGAFDPSGKTAARIALTTTLHERFKIAAVHRSQLRGSPYNPRKITTEARKRLKEKLAEVGLVEPLIWNRTTGYLLSGHQRIGLLDELEGTADYSLDVSVVELDERKEKALNVFFNNRSSQGDYDMAALETLIRELGSDVSGTGFVKEDLSFLVNDLAAGTETTESTAGESLASQGDELANQLVVFFPDSASVQEFLRGIGKPPGERYVKGEDVARALGVAL